MLVRAALLVLLALAGSSPAWATGPITYPPGGSGSGSAGFDAITSGTNTTATMVVGTGGSLATSGSGTIVATTAAALTTDPAACTGNNWVKDFNAAGTLVCTQPDFTNISGSVTDAQVPDTITLTNITQIGTRPHSSLTGLTSGDDHTQYTLLAGRTSTTNNTILSTDADGSLFGSHVASKKLILRPNDIDLTTGTIQLDAPTTVLWSDFPATTNATQVLLTATPTVTFSGSSGKYYFAKSAPVITTADTAGISHFYAGGSIDRTGTTASTLYSTIGFNYDVHHTSSSNGPPLVEDALDDSSTTRQIAGTATTAFQPITVTSKPGFSAATGASLTISQTTALDAHPTWGEAGTGTLVNTTYSAVRVHKPCVDPDTSLNYCAGSVLPTLTNYIGLDVQDLDETSSTSCAGSPCAVTTNPMSLRSIGTTTQMRHAGPARFGAVGAPTTTTFGGLATAVDNEGSEIIKGVLHVGDDITDAAASTVSVIDIQPTIDATGAGAIRGVNIIPVTAQSDSSAMVGVEFSPVVTQSGSSKVPNLFALDVAGTTTATTANFPGAAIVRHARTYTSATVNATPMSGLSAISDTPTISHTAASSTVSVTSDVGMLHNPTLTLNGLSSTMTLAADIGLSMTGTYTKTSGTTLQVTKRVGLDFPDVTNNSATVPTNVAVDVGNLASGTTERTALRSTMTANSVAYFLHDTGGAQMATAGKFTTYNNVAADTSHSGVPLTGWSVSATAQTANIAAANLIASATAGRYRMCGYVAVTTQATTTSTVPNVAITCTDPTDSVAKTVEITGAITAVAANPTTAVAHSGCGICDAKASTAIKYSTTDYASTGATPMAYKVYVTLEVM